MTPRRGGRAGGARVPLRAAGPRGGRVVAAVAWHRRLLASGLAALTVALGLGAVAPEPARTVGVVTAARDLPAGAVLRPGDVTTLALPEAAVPDGALRPGQPVAGRVAAGPVRRGEALTDVRLVGAGLLDALGPGLVATPVRLADAGSARLLRAGDRVDVLAARPARAGALAPEDPTGDGAGGAPSGAAAGPVVTGAPVLAVPAADDAGLTDGALVVLATEPAAASALAAAALDGPLSVVLRRPG